MTTPIYSETEWMTTFAKFIKYLRIDSKELSSSDTRGSELKLWTSQRLFLSELAKGLSRGVRIFYCLKSRQQGISTVSLAIDLFWLAMHPGTIGCLVVEKEPNREAFRAILKRYMQSFPPNFFGESFKLLKDNREMMMFSNGSRLDFLVAGQRSKTNWAEGRGYAYAHLTEVAGFGDSRGLDSFQESMAQGNPDRLYLYESTAKGFNHWKDMYEEAKRDPLTKHSFFIGWPANDMNQIAKTDPRFELYGMEPPDEEEKKKILRVKQDMGLSVTKEQLAWYRWYTSDTSKDLEYSKQNQPWDDEECFVQSGHSFFDSKIIQKDLDVLEQMNVRMRGFKFVLADSFHASRMIEISDQSEVEEVDLKMWEEPVDGAIYTIGVDAALGRTDGGDRNTIEVFRCYADKLVQCAEWASSMDDTRQAAWVLAYLAGVYRNCRINVDVTGGYGVAIMNELDSLRQRMRTDLFSQMTGNADWQDFLCSAQWYLYHRPDTMGAGYAKNFVWSSKTKYWGANSYRDSYACGMLIIYSKALLNEMSKVVRDGLELGARIEARGKEKDDRVFAAVLAEIAWKEWIRTPLINENYTYESVNKAENPDKKQLMSEFTSNLVYNFITARADQIENMDTRPTWMVNKGLA